MKRSVSTGPGAVNHSTGRGLASCGATGQSVVALKRSRDGVTEDGVSSRAADLFPLYDSIAVQQLGGVPVLLSAGSSLIAETLAESVDTVRGYRRQLVTAARYLAARGVCAVDERVSLGCAVLDGVFHGGLTVASVSELTGASGAGKTQLCLQMAVQCCTDHTDSRVVYVSTEGAVPTSRLAQICRARGLPEQLLDRVLLHVVVEVHQLLALFVRQLPRLATALGGRLRLVMLDSVAAPFRAGYDMSDGRRRAEQMQALGAALRSLAVLHGVAVVCVNQVTACVGSHCAVGEAATRPALGLAWSSQLNSRLLVTRTEQKVVGTGERRLMKLHTVFSPYLPPNTAHFQIIEKGVEGLFI